MRRLAVAAALWASACANGPPPLAAPDPAGRLEALSDRYVRLRLEQDPTSAYSNGLEGADHGRWGANAPAEIARLRREGDRLHAELLRIDAAALPDGLPAITYAMLREEVEAERQLRVCRSELWNVSHMDGWHGALADVAKAQPVSTAEERAQALRRWRALPAFVDQEIANLRRGLALGYSAPKSVVRRVIRQASALAAPGADSPLLSPAERSSDAGFQQAFRRLVPEQAQPAIGRYVRFLETEYLPRAREVLGVSALPDGAACYRASLRAYTTLDRDPQAVNDLGRAAVEENLQAVRARGAALFGTRGLPEIVDRLAAAPDNRFAGEQELLAFSEAAVTRARLASARLFHQLPAQELRVAPLELFLRGSGASPYYDVQPDDTKPAFYRVASEKWAEETRANAEIAAVHEGYPGHHVQITAARRLGRTPLMRVASNSAYVEGWGRYAEILAGEEGLYASPYAAISRGLWPARGMVADTGLHVLGWSREQTVAYLKESGRLGPDMLEALPDRMAALPGQLTAYDTGALELLALRREARAALGPRFDIRDFHGVVLGSGALPLGALQRQVRAWIARGGGAAAAPLQDGEEVPRAP